MRSFVLARKGVLVSNPDVARMTTPQWVYEYHILQKRDREYFEAFAKILRNVIIGTFGLNMLRPQDENGVPKTAENMSPEEKDFFLPLVGWIGNPELLKAVKEQVEKEYDPSLTPDTKEYDNLVARIDDNPDDMEAILGVDEEKDRRLAEETKAQLRAEKLKSLNIKSISEADVGDI